MPAATPLFYATTIAHAELLSVLYGVSAPTGDVITFDEAPTTVARELGFPFQAGMDEIQVDEARLQVRAVSRALPTEQYTISNSTAAPNQGLVVALKQPGRLKSIELQSAAFPLVALPDQNLTPRIVVRPATGQAPGWSFGPPIFAAPSFALPSPLFGPVLGGLATRALGGNRLELQLPSVAGTAWLIQLATGDEATKLAAQPFTATVNKVVIDAAPSALSLVIADPAGDIVLWSYPNAFLPEVGVQNIAFTPLAQSALAKRLAAAAPDAVTLTLPLRFTGSGGGALEITSKVLTAHYVVKPISPEPASIALVGSAEPLPLSAPGGAQPYAGSLRLRATLRGRELNGGSPPAPAERPTSGVGADPGRWLAAAMPFAPAGSAAAGSILPLVGVRLYLAAPAEAEAVLEIHTDAAGAPGPIAGKPIVRQLPKGDGGWVEFELASALPVVTGQAPVWLVLRSTKGLVLWFTTGPGSARLSLDRGATWGSVDARLTAAGAPLAQLFHALPDPLPQPTLSLLMGDQPIVANLLADAAPDTTRREWSVPVLDLPAAVRSRLGGAGAGRSTTSFRLFSRSVMDLTVDSATLAYEPFAPGQGGG